MSPDELKEWLHNFVSELADAFHGDLDSARHVLAKVSRDAHPDLRGVAAEVGEAIVEEQKRRGKAQRLAGIVTEKRVELNGSTPPGIPARYHGWIARVCRSIERLESGGLSKESSANVARGIEADLQAIREQARRPREGHTKGEKNPAIRGWLKRHLATLQLRYFEAGR